MHVTPLEQRNVESQTEQATYRTHHICIVVQRMFWAEVLVGQWGISDDKSEI